MRTTPTSRTNGAHAGATAAAVLPVPAQLDELLTLDSDHLAVLYAGARVPRLSDLSGDLRGRMLAWPAVPGIAGAALRALGRWGRFPWRGKTFRHQSDALGEGDNRLFADRFHRYRFETSIGRSRAGAFDAVHLDYDHDGNPFFVRAIHDELRQLRPGLYLGQGWLIRPGTPRLLLYFGLEQNLVG